MNLIDESERAVWARTLRQTQGSIRRAAALLQRSRPTALKKIRAFGLQHLTQNNRKYAWRKPSKSGR